MQLVPVVLRVVLRECVWILSAVEICIRCKPVSDFIVRDRLYTIWTPRVNAVATKEVSNIINDNYGIRRVAAATFGIPYTYEFKVIRVSPHHFPNDVALADPEFIASGNQTRNTVLIGAHRIDVV